MLVRAGERCSGEARPLDEFSNQFQIFASLLQDEPGLFRHAYNWAAPQDPDVYWARGNAWITAAGYEYLRVRAARGERDDAVAGALERQVAAVLGAQDQDSGLWWTIMNRPGEIYLETSATALFAVGLARGLRHGFLDASVRPAIDRAMAGVRSRIEEDGSGRPVVTGISGPTTVGKLEDYAAVEAPRRPLVRRRSRGPGARRNVRAVAPPAPRSPRPRRATAALPAPRLPCCCASPTPQRVRRPSLRDGRSDRAAHPGASRAGQVNRARCAAAVPVDGAQATAEDPLCLHS